MGWALLEHASGVKIGYQEGTPSLQNRVIGPSQIGVSSKFLFFLFSFWLKGVYSGMDMRHYASLLIFLEKKHGKSRQDFVTATATGEG